MLHRLGHLEWKFYDHSRGKFLHFEWQSKSGDLVYSIVKTDEGWQMDIDPVPEGKYFALRSFAKIANIHLAKHDSVECYRNGPDGPWLLPSEIVDKAAPHIRSYQILYHHLKEVLEDGMSMAVTD